ncbi:hypothetical protein [Methylorubrum extorquens]|uniref:hypothetical protein n=1 Tax=Methylorubrum extorquens TaxID=408 RepID=UPI0022378E1C|nr:hypothetical protein [Methylorubrum extorquens]UYW34489.1 hypothetical protein OKB92_10525 [Methylorubrum extorquens]
MPLYGPSTATATVTANTNVVSITGMDLNAVVQQGMTINLGARDRAVGDAWIINTVVPNGTNGGTLTTAGSIPTAYNSVPFLIDTRGFNGTDSSFAAAVSLKLLATLSTLLGTATNLFAGSRQLVLDKVASTAIGRIAFAITGRTWGDIAQRSHTYTPTGGQAATIETLAVRAFPDGATPTDALLFDLGSGTGDLRKGSATMVAASTVDLGSAPMGKVAIAGSTAIAGFGPGKHLERLVHFVDGGNTLTHSASLILPGAANIVTRAGDTLHATSDGSGNWRVRSYDRASGLPLAAPFRNAGYATLTTQQFIAAADNGRAFIWAIASSYVVLPLGSSVFPGWSCQIKFIGNAVSFGGSSVVTPGFTDTMMFNGLAQKADTTGSKGFVVVGGGEEFRFTWSGAEWIVETIQSPTPGHFGYARFGGSGGYANTPTALTVVPAGTTGGNNNAAAAPFNLGMYAPCDGIYRLHARTRFYNDVTNALLGGVLALSDQSPANSDFFDGLAYRSYQMGEYEDAISRCTKRLFFGQQVAAYKAADNAALKTAAVYEVFYAELLSRG